MKIVLYAICKNEISNIHKFMESANEADEIVVLDTASDDGTFENLELLAKTNPKLQIHLAKFENFRFDQARNFALNQVNECDYVVWMDFDETFEKGWREKLEVILKANPDQVTFQMNLTSDGSEGTTQYNQVRCHRWQGYNWRYPCHEIVVGSKAKAQQLNSDINVYQHNSGEQKDYLELLKWGTELYPNDQRATFYYARELFYRGQHLQAVKLFEEIPKQKYMAWDRYVADSFKYIAYCYAENGLNNKFEQEKALLQYYALSLEHAEAYDELAMFYYLNGDLKSARAVAERALKLIQSGVKTDNFIYRDLGCWTWKPHDLLAFCANERKDNSTYLLHALEAYSMNKENERLINNAMDALALNGHKLSLEEFLKLSIVTK